MPRWVAVIVLLIVVTGVVYINLWVVPQKVAERDARRAAMPKHSAVRVP